MAAAQRMPSTTPCKNKAVSAALGLSLFLIAALELTISLLELSFLSIYHCRGFVKGVARGYVCDLVESCVGENGCKPGLDSSTCLLLHSCPLQVVYASNFVTVPGPKSVARLRSDSSLKALLMMPGASSPLPQALS